jgi:hypothetical protein
VRTSLLDWVLSIAAVAAMCGMLWWLARDVKQTVNRPVPPPLAQRLAQADLHTLPGGLPGEDPQPLAAKYGWFPTPQQPIFSWEGNEEGWKLEADEPLALAPPGPEALSPDGAPERPPETRTTSERLRVSEERATDGKFSLAIPVNFPDPTTIFCRAALLRGVRFIAYDIYVPAELGGYVGCLFFLKDKDGRWFQARSRTPLRPGTWTTVTADIRGGSADVEPLGHLGQWDENQASQVQLVGLTFYGERTCATHLYLDNFRGWLRSERFTKLVESKERLPGISDERRKELESFLPAARSQSDEPLALLNLRTEPAAPSSTEAASPAVGLYDAFTVRFELNRQVLNPFNPEEADVRATVETPSGKRVEVSGFWYQDFEARDRFASEELVPMGRPEWRVRVTPRELGEYRVQVHVNLDGGKVRAASPVQRFQATPSRAKGFVRVSARDANFFEFENGEPFYPIGHNLHSPVDMRCWSKIFEREPPLPRGLKMYEDFLPKMAKAGENVAEVWMAAWWLGIEWTRHWPNYHGKGRYSLERAWKMDRLLELARAHGILLHIVIDNHGKFSDYCDEEWDKNPYNVAADGPGWGWLQNASDFFTDPLARKMHQQRLRYIAARWAGDPTVLGWEMVSEYDLTGSRNNQVHRTPEGRAWYREMAQYLRSVDPTGRPVTNHYCADYSHVDRELADSPAMDYIVGDAYHDGPGYASLALATATHFDAYTQKKPYWITEYGGHWTNNSELRLKADVHAGLWASWMTHTAGTPLFWWYDVVDYRNLYPHYRAFANYARGEDRRGLNGRTEHLEVGVAGLAGLAYRWPSGMYGWVYHVESMGELPEPKDRPRFEGVEVSLRALTAGRYQVEFWDTWGGDMIASDTLETDANGRLKVRLPAFLSDIAFKVKRPNEASLYGQPAPPPTSGVPAVAPPRLPEERR